MTLFDAVIVSVSACYAAVLLWIRAGLRRLDQGFNAEQPTVSVVVAARNEAVNIPSLIQAFKNQDYPPHLFEVIIVDDESEDETAELLRGESDARFRWVQTVNRRLALSPKKNAVDLGIRHARGEIILLTDADCRPPSGWISGLVRLFTPETGMVTGFSPCELPRLRTLSDRLLALDSLALAAVAAGTAGRNAAATCNGRNLAYRKSVYRQVGGFNEIAHFISGDDDLLLKLVQRTKWRIRYAYDAELIVPTMRTDSFRQFIRQRLRHASKGFSYSLKKVVALVLVYGYHVLLFTAPAVGLTGSTSLPAVLVALSVKASADFLLLRRFAKHMRRAHYLSVFAVAELLHIPYVVVFGALGPFLKIKWK